MILNIIIAVVCLAAGGFGGWRLAKGSYLDKAATAFNTDVATVKAKIADVKAKVSAAKDALK